MEHDALFMSLLDVGRQAGCSKEEVVEALVILRQNGCQERLFTCILCDATSSCCALQDFRGAQCMHYRSLKLPCLCKRVVKRCLRLVATGKGSLFLGLVTSGTL